MRLLIEVERHHAERTQSGEFWERHQWFRSLSPAQMVDCLRSGDVEAYRLRDLEQRRRRDAAGK
jgi:hypothetical protein